MIAGLVAGLGHTGHQVTDPFNHGSFPFHDFPPPETLPNWQYSNEFSLMKLWPLVRHARYAIRSQRSDENEGKEKKGVV